MAAWLRFAKLNLNKPQDFRNNAVWTDETRIKMFGHNAQQHVRREYQHEQLIPTHKRGSGGVMIWACFAATRPRKFSVTESTVNSLVYQSIPQSNVRPFVSQLKFGSNWVIARAMIPNTANLQSTVSEKEKNQGVAIVQSKSRPQPD